MKLNDSTYVQIEFLQTTHRPHKEVSYTSFIPVFYVTISQQVKLHIIDSIECYDGSQT
jgi:hypothetical protein